MGRGLPNRICWCHCGGLPTHIPWSVSRPAGGWTQDTEADPPLPSVSAALLLLTGFQEWPPTSCCKPSGDMLYLKSPGSVPTEDPQGPTASV